MEEDEGHDDQRRGARDPPPAGGRARPPGAREDWRIICDLARAARRRRQVRLPVDRARSSRSCASPRKAASPTTPASRGSASTSEMGVFWPCPTLDHPGTPRLYEGLAVRPSRRQGALPAGRLAAGRRRARRRLSDRADDRPRRVAVSLRHADAPHRRARGPVSAAAAARSIRGWPARSASPTAISSRVESRRGAVVVRAQVVKTIRPDTVFVPYHWPLDRVGEQLHHSRDRSDLQDSRVQDLRRARLEGAERRPARSPRSSPRPEASGERARLLHRLLALHRLPGVRAGVRGVRHPPRTVADPPRDDRAPRQRADGAAGVHALRGPDLRAGLSGRRHQADGRRRRPELAQAALHRLLELRARLPVRRAEVRRPTPIR